MSITIDQPIVLASAQTITFDQVYIQGGAIGKLSALVTFVVTNEKGERIDTLALKYEGEDWNVFQKNFNSWGYLYEELVKKQKLDVKIDPKVEESFVNVVDPVESIFVEPIPQ